MTLVEAFGQGKMCLSAGPLFFRFSAARQNRMIRAMKKLISVFLTYCLCGSVVAFASNDSSLNQAIGSLNARAKTDADKKLVLKAISQQSQAAREDVAITDERNTSGLW